MLANLFGKYKTLVVSIALFLLLDASVLIVNFYTSFQISIDAKAVNLAGRQRMLSQRMVKSLLEIDKALSQGQAPQKYIDELTQTTQLFNSTLNAFDAGGVVVGTEGESIQLEQIKPGSGREALLEAKQLWQAYKQQIDQVVRQQTPEDLGQTLLPALAYARSNNVQILKLMNALTLGLEQVASDKASQLRAIQMVAIGLALLNFFLIMYHFLGQLRRSDLALDASRKETQNILDTVNEGLFLLDSELRMGTQHSAKLKEMFGNSARAMNIDNCHFGEFLRDRVKPRDLETAQRFVNLLFRKNIKTNLIGDLNPLKQVEINIAEEGGGFATKYMHFDFRRVLAHEDIKHVLVTVTDITKEVMLGKELDESKAENALQIEMLTGILHANPKVLKLFIINAFDAFKRMNDLFRQQDKTSKAMERKLRDVFIEVHNFKAEAASLNLGSVVTIAHELETVIQSLLELPTINGTDLLGAVVVLEKLIYYTEGIQALAEKLASLSQWSEPAALSRPPAVNRWQHLQTMAQVLAERNGKKLALHLTGFNEIDMSEETARLINDMCLQFIRNAVMHGIERPEIRRQYNKPDIGRVDLSLIQIADGGLEINVRDDGCGVDYDKIRQQAIAMGLANADELNGWNNKQIVGLIFKPGFSTASETTNDAGRGVGMDVIVSRVQRLHGSIKIASRKGQACEFCVTLPGIPSKQAAA